MQPSDQPLTPEGEYLLYLLKVSEDGALPAWRTIAMGELTWLERQERAALYALGRIRESLTHRIKRLDHETQAEERAFLASVLAYCQGEDGGRVIAPRWPASSLGSAIGMLRQRLFLRRAA
jgi:hypothetical protein